MDKIFKILNPACCTPPNRIKKPGLGQPFVTGTIDAPAGEVPVISGQLSFRDYWGTVHGNDGPLHEKRPAGEDAEQ